MSSSQRVPIQPRWTVPTLACKTYYTNYNDPGNSNVIYLDRHSMYCRVVTALSPATKWSDTAEVRFATDTRAATSWDPRAIRTTILITTAPRTRRKATQWPSWIANVRPVRQANSWQGLGSKGPPKTESIMKLRVPDCPARTTWVVIHSPPRILCTYAKMFSALARYSFNCMTSYNRPGDSVFLKKAWLESVGTQKSRTVRECCRIVNRR